MVVRRTPSANTVEVETRFRMLTRTAAGEADGLRIHRLRVTDCPGTSAPAPSNRPPLIADANVAPSRLTRTGSVAAHAGAIAPPTTQAIAIAAAKAARASRITAER